MTEHEERADLWEREPQRFAEEFRYWFEWIRSKESGSNEWGYGYRLNVHRSEAATVLRDLQLFSDAVREFMAGRTEPPMISVDLFTGYLSDLRRASEFNEAVPEMYSMESLAELHRRLPESKLPEIETANSIIRKWAKGKSRGSQPTDGTKKSDRGGKSVAEDEENLFRSVYKTIIGHPTRDVFESTCQKFGIPPVSLLVKSGRGVWCLWLLADRFEGTQGQKATDYAIPLAELIQRDLWRKLQGLGADSNARDLCRITRVPGSINGKSGRRTEYWIRSDESGRIATYTLDELASLLGVVVPWGRVDRPRCLEKRKAGLAGYAARWLGELKRFRTLWASRGMFVEGTRGGAVFLYFKFLRRCQAMMELTDEEIRAEMEVLYLALEQPGGKRLKRRGKGVTTRDYPRTDFEKAIGRKNTGANPSHAMISQLLRINRHESTLTGWPEWGMVIETEKTAKQKQVERQRLLRLMLFRGDGTQKPLPSLRDLQDQIRYLDSELECAHKTIERDLAVIGIKNPRRIVKRTGPELFTGQE